MRVRNTKCLLPELTTLRVARVWSRGPCSWMVPQDLRSSVPGAPPTAQAPERLFSTRTSGLQKRKDGLKSQAAFLEGGEEDRRRKAESGVPH
ncbi:hypothetical protein NDU88_005061 [Pleurodeles waltl]|uniref:Uncharacterized protein n=1 Tax=Pleurodeles waltl TaxID=8319 RepID=A0AAV7KZK5_PLEWA|nr:hypothetical protein NDU88_005061 [Pleurodeles waltl]